MTKRGIAAVSFCIFAICLLMATFLTACGGPHSGYVYSKRVVPPMDWVWLEPVMVGKTIVLIPINEHSDECPELTLKQDPNKSDTSTVCVDQATYQHINIGDFYQEQGT